MNDEYFTKLFNWLREEGGLQVITNWLLNYPIEMDAIPKRAPKTSSHAEAVQISRSPMEVIINDMMNDGVAGFAGGYVSTIAVIQRCKEAGMRSPNTRTVQKFYQLVLMEGQK